MHCKLTKLLLEEERLATVEKERERDNCFLTKMSFTMGTHGRVDMNDYCGKGSVVE